MRSLIRKEYAEAMNTYIKKIIGMSALTMLAAVLGVAMAPNTLTAILFGVALLVIHFIGTATLAYFELKAEFGSKASEWAARFETQAFSDRAR